MKQYFTNNDNLDLNKEITLSFEYYNNKLLFKSNDGLFSKDELDKNSILLLNNIDSNNYQHILDLGCGYGFIGICLSKRFNTKVDFIDVTNQAIYYTKKNCLLNNIDNYQVIQSDGVKNINKYDLITLNPPIHAGKEVCYTLYQESYEHLTSNGSLIIVINKKHGALSTIEYLKTLGQVIIKYKKKQTYIIELTR
ncbi:MAG: methyltransferase [Bacilli bacterium]|jgi:16S rRNA (guanine1207-N2)-methyltransferase|nr:methyltransferase [Bacilli bacterium]